MRPFLLALVLALPLLGCPPHPQQQASDPHTVASVVRVDMRQPPAERLVSEERPVCEVVP